MTTDINDVLHQLSEIITDIVDSDGTTLAEKTIAEDVEGWDSLANIRFMLAVERHFDVRFSANEMESFKDVGSLARCIVAKIN